MSTKDALQAKELRTNTAEDFLREWNNKLKEERFMEEHCRGHGMESLANWHEGKADALEYCALQLEYSILGELKAARALAEDRRMLIKELRHIQREQALATLRNDL